MYIKAPRLQNSCQFPLIRSSRINPSFLGEKSLRKLLSAMRTVKPRRHFIRLSFFIVLVSIIVSVVRGSQDHDVPVSIDGLRCDSCGSECAVMCGSKIFRACCYNYIKKRSTPWTKHVDAEPIGEGEALEGKFQSSLSGADGPIDEATYLFPVIRRELMGSVFRNVNAVGNHKYVRMMV